MAKGQGFRDKGRDSRAAAKARQEKAAGKGKSSEVVQRKAGSGGNPNPREDKRQ